MAEEKRFYWIKLKENFFDLDTIDWLISQKNGCEYVVLYQKLCLLTANKNGEMVTKIGEMIIPYDVTKIARDTKMSIDTVAVAMELFTRLGLIYEQQDGILKIPYVDEIVGSETSGAQRMREHRARKEAIESGEIVEKKEPKSNAVRQRQFRAKKSCEQKQHIPYIEDYINNKRYNGNYYIVFKRDKYRCAVCGNIENLCVHHIDGYNENKPENSDENKMVTLCRQCHSTTHAGTEIPKYILDSIDYYNDSNELSLSDIDVTQEIDNRDKIIENRYKDIIEYLNKKTQKHYKPTIAKTQTMIKARMNEGFTTEDFITVIDKKCAEWLGTEWEKFLRPETLFGTKFEGYLNAKEKEKTDAFDDNTYMHDELEKLTRR